MVRQLKFGDGPGGAQHKRGEGSLVAFIDGGARGNPGIAGAGVHFERDRKPWKGLYRYLGEQTNNYAEYSALLAALDFALDSGFSSLTVHSDSELLVRQVEGIYRVKNPGLKVLHALAAERISRLRRFKICHIPREKNRRADALANLAQDRRASGEVEGDDAR